MIRCAGIQKWLVGLAAAVSLTGVVSAPAHAFRHHGGNFFQRHRTLTTLGAGYGAYRLSKTSGRNRMASGRRGNFMQRHPVLTGLGAAAIAHHYTRRR